ncbi:hypothetical protein WMF38_29040 [Sorangium sp. So ce118]
MLLPALLAVEACSSPQVSTPKQGLPPPGGPTPAGQLDRGQAGPGPTSSDGAMPELLRCPAQDSDSSRTGEWMMASGGRLCCALRSPAPGWQRSDVQECLRSAAPALAEPAILDRSLDGGPLVQPVRFDRGSAKLAGPLLDTAQLLTRHPDLQLFLHGTTRCGETASGAAAARLAADRVSAVRDDLTQHGVKDSQLVTQDRSEFLRTREDLLHREALALLDAPSVLVYSASHNMPFPPPPPLHHQCVPGAIATLLLPTAELQGSRLTIETCHAARCASAQLSLDTLRWGDSAVLALEGGLSAGARLTWNQPDGAILKVGTAMAEARLASGDWFSLRVRVDEGVVAHVEEPLKYTQEKNSTASGSPCLRAQVRGDVPFL